MVDISHDKAVSILKATSERVLLRIEKNAISRSSQPVSTDEDEVWLSIINYHILEIPIYIVSWVSAHGCSQSSLFGLHGCFIWDIHVNCIHLYRSSCTDHDLSNLVGTYLGMALAQDTMCVQNKQTNIQTTLILSIVMPSSKFSSCTILKVQTRCVKKYQIS